MHHKRGRSRNQRAGCKMCKFWKVNGYSIKRKDGEKFSDHRRRRVSEMKISNVSERESF